VITVVAAAVAWHCGAPFADTSSVHGRKAST
jgi:hypothetical protein